MIQHSFIGWLRYVAAWDNLYIWVCFLATALRQFSLQVVSHVRQ